MEIDTLLGKISNFGSLTQREKVKYIAYFYCLTNEVEVFGNIDLKLYFDQYNLKIPANLSRELLSLTLTSPPVLLKRANYYCFERNSKKKLDDIFISSKQNIEVSFVLRSLTFQVSTQEQKKFLEEAIACFEINSFRASIIMTWLLAMDIVLENVLSSHLAEFNDELRKKNKKKFIIKKSDFEEYKESEIIETMRAAGIISKEQKKVLDIKLDIRNSAAHPNNVNFRESKVITYIQELVEEIISKFHTDKTKHPMQITNKDQLVN